MYKWFVLQDAWLQALIATIFTWLVTAAGAAVVLFVKNVNGKLIKVLLGLAGGVMMAASIWSLLEPAISLAEENGSIPWLVASIGFMLGVVFIWLMDKFVGRVIDKRKDNVGDGAKRSVLLTLAVTLHNIPEGLAIGVLFGSVALGIPEATIGAAIALALGIAIQNFPEGGAVSLPLKAEGMSRRKAFLIGQGSAIVEPIAGVIGALLVVSIKGAMPYVLSFAAGSMIFVVVKELIPESQEGPVKTQFAVFGFMLGFVIMMILDLALS